MLNILITGADGQLGSEIKALEFSYNYTFYFTNRVLLDIEDYEKVDQFIDKNNINIIINCAAYTAVDLAENDIQNADKINHMAVKYLSQISKEKDIKLIHISTDYVFDGKNYRPYIENDKPIPCCIYGNTKLAGEMAMQEINPQNSIIIRTSWLYSSHGSNFLKTMLRLFKQKDKLDIIFDQIGTPTYAKDLAKVILDIIPSIKNLKVEIYHYSNEGVLSWYDFAKEIIRHTKFYCQIDPIETRDYPTIAKRPLYSLLNKAKIKKDFDIVIPYWKDSLKECIKQISEQANE